jgi:hypothetical protein
MIGYYHLHTALGTYLIIQYHVDKLDHYVTANYECSTIWVWMVLSTAVRHHTYQRRPKWHLIRWLGKQELLCLFKLFAPLFVVRL